MKKINLIFILTLVSATLFAQIPDGYYDAAEGQTGDNLKEQLEIIITAGHSVVSYTGLWTAYSTTDVYPDPNDNVIWDMYSSYGDGTYAYEYTLGNDQCGNVGTEGTCYNREHTVPKSWFGGDSPMYSDLFIVYPTDGQVNGKRGSDPYGETNSPSWTSQNGSKTGPCTYPNYSGTVFEPIDEYKGDIARSYFYDVTRYDVSSWSGASFDGNGFSTWTLEMLLEWNLLDPVSQKEIDRNNAVYPVQHNRNPYIDHPEWVECVFNNNCGSVVNPPQNFVAEGTAINEIGINWNLNAENNNVVLAFNTTNDFGTPTETYTVDDIITGGGTVLYTGGNTNYTHSVSTSETYYYKIWSYDGTDYSSGISAMATPLIDAPSNHVTNFITLNPNATTLDVSWTDATGIITPIGYLIKANLVGDAITPPIDGQVENDGIYTKNISYGDEIVTFENLTQNTEYDFEIYSYSNSGSNIDYKIDGIVPQTSGTTTDMPDYCGNETFENIGTAMYETTTWTGDDGSTWTATDARTDQILNGKAICIRDGYVESGTIPNGVGEITISTKLPFTSDTSGDLIVKINGDQVGTVPYVPMSTTEFLTTIIPNVNISGDIVIKIESNNGDRVLIDDVIWSCYGTEPENDSDSDIGNPIVQIDAVTIFNTETNFVDVFSFSLEDKGTTDVLPTILNSLKIYHKLPENTATWTNSINAVKINNGTTDLVLGTVTITDDYINIPFVTPYEISNNSTEEFTLAIEINGSEIIDQSVLSFMIDADNSGFITEATGSSFLSVLNYGNDILSNSFLLEFVSGINENNQSKFDIYPNPSSSGTFNIISDKNLKTQIYVYDINGKVIDFKKINDNTYHISKEGLFFIKIETENSVIWKKIILN